MIVHDKEIGVVRLLDKDDAGCINCMPAESGCASLDCKPSYEELLADYQELKHKHQKLEHDYQELEHEVTRQRSWAGRYKRYWQKGRTKLDAKSEELKRISRVSKDALSLDKEVQRLRALLEEVGVDTRKRSTIVSLRMENGSLKDENDSLKDKNANLMDENADLIDENDDLIDENDDLIDENGNLKNENIELKDENAEMKKQVKNLLSNRKVLSNSLYGRRSEKQKSSPSGRRRGQQPGAPGHGRTARPDIEVVEESWHPSDDEITCSCCGERYVANGKRTSKISEIKVKAHTRRINRFRYRRSCDCESSPLYVTAPAPARLFEHTPYGTSVWALLIYERYWNLRPYRSIEKCFSDHGFKISAGTLADSAKRLLPLFETLYDAILAHQNEEKLRHADETSWRIQSLKEVGGSQRAWLWTSVSKDSVLFNIHRWRSSEAAKVLFIDSVDCIFLVCDRHGSYKKMVRDFLEELNKKVTLCFCWAHVRRDFIKCAAGDEQLEQWNEQWIERIAEMYKLNKQRCDHYVSGNTVEFERIQIELKKACDALFSKAESELSELAEDARERKPLKSLMNHREGLSVFVEHPQVPMDNNIAERALRWLAIARKLSFGSDSEEGARTSAILYTVLGTLAKNGIDVLSWLKGWLRACAEDGRSPPKDLSPWLPWSMSEQRLRDFGAKR